MKALLIILLLMPFQAHAAGYELGLKGFLDNLTPPMLKSKPKLTLTIDSSMQHATNLDAFTEKLCLVASKKNMPIHIGSDAKWLKPVLQAKCATVLAAKREGMGYAGKAIKDVKIVSDASGNKLVLWSNGL